MATTPNPLKIHIFQKKKTVIVLFQIFIKYCSQFLTSFQNDENNNHLLFQIWVYLLINIDLLFIFMIDKETVCTDRPSVYC